MTTRNEFIAKRLRDEVRVYTITIPLLITCVVAAVVLTIVAIAMGKNPMSLGAALIMISIGLQLPVMIQHRKACQVAEQEFEAYAHNPNAQLSVATENLIDRFESRSISELRQVVIAFSLVGVMLIAMGIFLFVILGTMSEGNIFLEVILPVLMGGGGAFVCMLAFNAWRDLKMARALQEMGE